MLDLIVRAPSDRSNDDRDIRVESDAALDSSNDALLRSVDKITKSKAIIDRNGANLFLRHIGRGRAQRGAHVGQDRHAWATT